MTVPLWLWFANPWLAAMLANADTEGMDRDEAQGYERLDTVTVSKDPLDS